MNDIYKQSSAIPPSSSAAAAAAITTTSQAKRNRRHSRRRSEHVSPTTCTHAFVVPMHGSWISLTLTLSLWKHILYARGLFPVPVYELLRFSSDVPKQDESCALTRTRGTAVRQHHPFAYKRKLNCAQRQVIALEAACEQVLKCPSLNVRAVIVSIGSTWHRPREVYTLHFPHDIQKSIFPCSDDNGNDKQDLRLKQQNAVSARLIRTLLIQEQECLAASMTNTPTVSRSVQHGSTERLYVTMAVTQESYQQLEYSFKDQDYENDQQNAAFLDNSNIVIRPDATSVLLPMSSSPSLLSSAMSHAKDNDDISSSNNSTDKPPISSHVCKRTPLERCFAVKVLSKQDHQNEDTVDCAATGCVVQGNQKDHELVWFSLSSTVKGFRL